ncbi:MAG: sigma-70 family RNA polymerase sigma factor [Acidimicrobiales bacterium]
MPPRTPQLGTEAGVRAAYAAHGRELHGFALRSLSDPGLAEEAVQEAFVRAWRAADRFDPDLGSLRGWLFAILRNVIVDLARSRAVRPPGPLGAAAAERDVAVTDDDLDAALLSWQVEEGLRRLTDEHRVALVETYYRGRSSVDVAAELGIPVGTVRSRVYYGLRALRLALEEMGWTDD